MKAPIKTPVKSSGFTLIEVLVVVAIIAILGALIGPQILDRVSGARTETARTQIKNIESALQLYKLDNFRYPTTDQGIEALVTKPETSPEPRNWKKGGYLKQLPKDPWGNPFIYYYDNGEYEIISYGADAEEGGEGDGADISSRDAS
jgi:general secretion pathway protein G